ncbi:MAG: chemotaxis protein CheW [Spirochaetia bacterium]|jgi:purine-binding chemotaxis protein CheW|nr:chemotaxis protein CheW [Spirochaetia bacterium]
MATEVKRDVGKSEQIVCFKIGKEEYGVDILLVQEILKLPDVTKLPKAASYVLGVMNLRGKVIPVVDLSIKFGINTGSPSRGIVVSIEGKQVGLAIDSVSHVVRINSTEIEPPPPVVRGISGKYIIGIAKIESGFVVILDLSSLFSSDEISAL